MVLPVLLRYVGDDLFPPLSAWLTALLDDPDLVVPDHLRGWIANNWGSRERFLRRGFGVACVHDRSVVSWSLADCRSGDACEIGIQTRPAFRRRGLATVTAAAAVTHALATGFAVVGWHANEDNRGSIATAERVGFSLPRMTANDFASQVRVRQSTTHSPDLSPPARTQLPKGLVAWGTVKLDPLNVPLAHLHAHKP